MLHLSTLTDPSKSRKTSISANNKSNLQSNNLGFAYLSLRMLFRHIPGWMFCFSGLHKG